MQLFITDKPRSESRLRDTEGEHMSAFCELCWSYDSFRNLTMFHVHGNIGNHEPAHPKCVLDLTKPGEYQLCLC